MSDETFLLDTGVFIQAHRMHYRFETFPGFWECLSGMHHRGRLRSIDKVCKEIGEGDSLAEWVSDGGGHNLFVSTGDTAVFEEVKTLQRWANRKDYTNSAKMDFIASEKADIWIIAYANVNRLTLVTQEKSDPKKKSKIKIPDVCKDFGIPCCNTFDMLSRLGVRFTWNPVDVHQ